MLKSGIKVGEEAQPPPKRSKADPIPDSLKTSGKDSNTSKGSKQDQAKSSRKQVHTMY